MAHSPNDGGKSVISIEQSSTLDGLLGSYILRWKFRRKKWTTYIPDNNTIDDDDYPDEDNDNVNMHQKWTIPDDDYDVNVLCAVINGSQIGDTFHLRLAQKTDDDEA